ncbi:hypothetical protein ACFVVX_03535 [Kitasatospora sp. NPDC058170]|uniref:hypothetical protein n=1 Tax=Kitasatospora sp. NPDC058170 TaxID=3346364 RepID=UPI0036DB70D8
MSAVRRNRRLGPVLVLALALPLAACGGETDKPTMTRAEAKAQTESYVARAVGALPQPATPVAERDNDGYCFKNDAPSEYDGKVTAVTERKLPGVPPDRHPEYFTAFRSQVEAMGFKLDDASGGFDHALFFTNHANDFTATLTELGDGDRTLSVSFVSPCVWPDGTRPPG